MNPWRNLHKRLRDVSSDTFITKGPCQSPSIYNYLSCVTTLISMHSNSSDFSRRILIEIFSTPKWYYVIWCPSSSEFWSADDKQGNLISALMKNTWKRWGCVINSMFLQDLKAPLDSSRSKVWKRHLQWFLHATLLTKVVRRWEEIIDCFFL